MSRGARWGGGPGGRAAHGVTCGAPGADVTHTLSLLRPCQTKPQGKASHTLDTRSPRFTLSSHLDLRLDVALLSTQPGRKKLPQRVERVGPAFNGCLRSRCTLARGAHHVEERPCPRR